MNASSSRSARGGQRIVRAGRFHADRGGVPAGVLHDEGAEGARRGRQGVAARAPLDRDADGVGGLAQGQGRDTPVEVVLAAHVLVQGRGAHADPLGQQAHRQAGEARPRRRGRRRPRPRRPGPGRP